MSDNSNPQSDAGVDMPKAGYVYIVDDNFEIRTMMCNLLNHYGLTVETYPDAESFFMKAEILNPAVILLDMTLPGMSGISAYEYLKKSGKTTPVIYVSGQSEHKEIISAMKLGADEFFLKPAPINELVAAIQNALLFDANQLARENNYKNLARLYSRLTRREKEIFAMMLNGMGNSEIAKKLKLMPDTVKKHRSKVMDKMETQTLSELILAFRDFKII